MTYTWDQVVAWLGLVIPMCALGWAAVQHVVNERREREHNEYGKFFEIMRSLGSKESTVSGNIAAIFELRRFPKYRDVIIRMCEDPKFQRDDPAGKLLSHEMQLTADYLRSIQ